MDRSLYNAAKDGKVDVLLLTENMERQLTPNNNTVLHIAAQFGRTECVRKILERCPPLLLKVNIREESSLYIAAREGHYDVVQALIECAKGRDQELESGDGAAKVMLRMTNEKKNTALHEAVRYNHLSVVALLTKEDPSEFLHLPNRAEETPLYVAAERGYKDLVSEILKICTSLENIPAFSGPDGRTALHAAVISDSEDITKTLLNRNRELIKGKDKHGWTPLHYAACLGYDSRVKQLLELDKSVAYLTADGDDKRTALHAAALRGQTNVMEVLLSYCPDCWEMVTSRGQNVLHIAVEAEDEKATEFILSNSSMISSLINEEDADGNTPLHFYAASNGNADNLLKHPKADKMAFNKNNLTPLDVVKFSDKFTFRGETIKKELERADAPLGLRNIVNIERTEMAKLKKIRSEDKKKIPSDLRKSGDTQLIVATLVATVTYAAGFTVPGGYDGNEGPNQGMAILSREAAFKAFVIADIIGMIFSTTAVFLISITTMYEDQNKILNRYRAAMNLIFIAQGAMVVAFITGLYVVLAHSLGLAIAVCVIGCLSFPIYHFVIKRANSDDI